MGILLFRVLFVAVTAAAGYFVPPFGAERIFAAVIAGLLAVGTLALEARVRKAPFKVIWSAVIGTLLGVVLGWILGRRTSPRLRIRPRPPSPDHVSAPAAGDRIFDRDAEVGMARPVVPSGLFSGKKRRAGL